MLTYVTYWKKWRIQIQPISSSLETLTIRIWDGLLLGCLTMLVTMLDTSSMQSTTPSYINTYPNQPGTDQETSPIHLI